MQFTPTGMIAPEGVVFYYEKDEKGIPYACIAITAVDDEAIHRGISLCSSKDNFSRKEARRRAYKRLRVAMQGETVEDVRRINTDRARLLVSTNGAYYLTHSYTFPSEYEKRLLQNVTAKLQEQEVEQVPA